MEGRWTRNITDESARLPYLANPPLVPLHAREGYQTTPEANVGEQVHLLSTCLPFPAR